MRKVPTERTVAAWQASIDQLGVARVKLRTLLKHFGFVKRGPQAVALIQNWLNEQEMYPRGLDALSLDDAVRLTAQPITTLGALVEFEKELDDRFKREIIRRLKLHSPQREHRAKGTRDRMDFLCQDREGRSVVVELKRDAGDKRAVEQVLRYIGQLKHEGGRKSPRGVLITGCADPDTRRALEGLDQDSLIDWWIYGLVEGELKLKQIKYRKQPVRSL